MPAYISHAIMGEKVLDKLNDELIPKINIDYNEMRTFSLGADLDSFSKTSNIFSHTKKTQDFFLVMINYIKNNKLYNDDKVMALLYGHIVHYFMDINFHPLIYYYAGNSNVSSIISNHTLIEGYINSFLCENILKKDIMEINALYFNQGKLNYIENTKLIKYVYKRVYNDSLAFSSYQKSIKWLTILENTIKNGHFTKKILILLSGFETFLKKTHLTKENLTNINEEEWTIPITGKKSTASIWQLYKKCLFDSIEAIQIVNSFIYDGRNRNMLEKIFNNISYNTGEDCDLGNDMRFVKKFIFKKK